ncbi:outer membrane biosynthesis protein TonB [Dokdonella fugitiva]|uniref:Outer membrane biosynthesis protein TonB n=1 Tax=Dokdonella fugitiva TaxID=328517 RepID=A0A839F699_9GAMM|nr:energy transducer TonB [Dokdonella fugitiva]MBA8888600.1 outer membrane biosynthesis protein TonB [Dokdonella fugitiva]
MLRRMIAVLAMATSTVAVAQSDAPPRVVVPDKLAGYWALVAASVEADVPIMARNISSPGCAAVSFVVEKDGRTSTIKVQRVVPAGDLAKVATSMASNMRFEPTVTNSGRDRVFSWLIFPFNAPTDPAARTAVMQQCQIDKLGWNDR